MICAVLLVLAASNPVGGVSAATDDHTILARFAAGDLLSLRRATVLRRQAGERVDIGRLGLLDDLSRLVRCLPIGPIPADETDDYRYARALVRLERVRLERLIRDRAHRGTALADLLAGHRLYQTEGARDGRLVRWPLEDEVWPGEILDPTMTPIGCPSRPGALKEQPEKVHRERRTIRLRAERTGIADMLGHLDRIPPHTASKIALVYLSDAEAADKFVVTETWRQTLEGIVRQAPPHLRTASGILLGRLAERANAKDEAIRHYRAVLADAARTADEDSRVRVRLAALLEPRWTDVLTVARGATKARSADDVVLINAEARALYALQEIEQLMTLGRKIVVRQDLSGPFFEQTSELLTLLALDLEPARALSWLAEIGPLDDTKRSERFEELAEMARERQKFDLAVAIYDQRRVDVAKALQQRGPRAVAEDAHLIARRAFIEYDREDVEAFAGFMDELVAMATNEQGRPIARFAPHKEVARLSQDLVGRLTDDVKVDRERMKYAALLLEATTKLTEKTSRYRRVLERYQSHLERLSGPFAAGRTKTAKAAAKKADTKRKPKKPVKQLGEVVVTRLPPQLLGPDLATPVPSIRTLLVYEKPDGQWAEGAPWTPLVPEKKKRIE